MCKRPVHARGPCHVYPRGPMFAVEVGRSGFTGRAVCKATVSVSERLMGMNQNIS
jgi:hypothetical protein